MASEGSGPACSVVDGGPDHRRAHEQAEPGERGEQRGHQNADLGLVEELRAAEGEDLRAIICDTGGFSP